MSRTETFEQARILKGEEERKRMNGSSAHPALKRDPLRMTFRYKKQNSTPALLLNGTTLINYGEIFVLVGQPGQGKTAVCEAVVCSYLDVPTFGFTCNGNDHSVLLIDTERHPDDVSDSYNNISRRLRKPVLDDDGEIARFTHLSVADIHLVDELKSLVEVQLATGSYNMMIVDGIIDFSASLNDDYDAVAVVKWLRMLAVKYNCAVVCTLHPNKGSETLAGHLGSFLFRWARAILFTRTTKQDRSVKELTGEPEMAKLSHGSLAALEPVYFSWDSSWNLLMQCNYQPSEDRGGEDKMKLALAVVLHGSARYRHGELIKAIMKLGHSQSTAKRWIKHGVAAGLIDNSSGIYKSVEGSGLGSSGSGSGSGPSIQGP